jgi:hypothetical protein
MTNALRCGLGIGCLIAFGCQQDIPHEDPAKVAVEVHVAPPPPPPHVMPPKPLPLPPPNALDPMAHHPNPRPNTWFRSLSVQMRRNVKQVCTLRASDPCAGLLRPFSDTNPDPAVPLLADMSDEQREGVWGYCDHVNRHKPGCNTPLVVAFDNQEVAFEPGAPFAFHAGESVSTDWPSVETPWIAIDRDGDGAITSGAELFGDATALSDGHTAPNGFAALAALDANGDGVLDARDPAFTSLLLWADRNGDRTSSPDELCPLASTITSIPLASTRTPRCTDRGDCEGERGIAHWRDGLGAERTGAVIDVYLRAQSRP